MLYLYFLVENAWIRFVTSVVFFFFFTFTDTQSGLSGGAIAGFIFLVLMVLILASVLCVVAIALYRKIQELKSVNQELKQKKNKGKEESHNCYIYISM